MKLTIKEDGKMIKVSEDVHRRLDIVRAEKQLKTFDSAINYLLNFERSHMTKVAA